MRLYLFFFLITISCFSQQEIINKNDSIISWKKGVSLNWDDFLGEPNFDYFGYAMTSYKIDIIPSEVLADENNTIKNYHDLTVMANFYKHHSWTISSDENLLTHEQIHFDIAEVFARKIRSRFSELIFINESNFDVYHSEYSKLWNEMRAFQKLYDLETNHGANQEKSLIWINKINKLLEENKP